MVISITVTWILLESDRVIFMQLSARPPDVNSVQVDAPTTNHLDKAALKITKKMDACDSQTDITERSIFLVVEFSSSILVKYYSHENQTQKEKCQVST